MTNVGARGARLERPEAGLESPAVDRRDDPGGRTRALRRLTVVTFRAILATRGASGVLSRPRTATEDDRHSQLQTSDVWQCKSCSLSGDAVDLVATLLFRMKHQSASQIIENCNSLPQPK